MNWILGALCHTMGRAANVAMNGRGNSEQHYPRSAPDRAPLNLDNEADQSLDSLLEVFWTIEDALGSYRNVVRLPAALFLEALPPRLRGPKWGTEPLPEIVVEVDPWDLMCKIKLGRVTYPVARIIHDLPPGWMLDEPGACIELDQAKVIAALPEHLRAILPP